MMVNRLISVAPMMACTDRHERYFLRLIAPNVLLYTEMVTTWALQHGDREKLLAYHAIEHPVALQLGGNDPKSLAACARWGELAGYDEINLNVGCPSPRVKAGCFGAGLMLEPDLVAACVAEMSSAVSVPVTVKCRIGVDAVDSLAALQMFIEKVAAAGASVFIIHARKAWLNGLSPKQNRTVPPLCYPTVYQIKQTFPHLSIILNGGVKTATDVQTHLSHVDGVMIGREAYANPWLLAELEQLFFPSPVKLTRRQVIEKYLGYVDQQLQQGVKLTGITRHLHGLFQGQVGARTWRRILSEKAHHPHAGIEVIQEALNYV